MSCIVLRVAVCCAVSYNVLQCVATCGSVLQCVTLVTRSCMGGPSDVIHSVAGIAAFLNTADNAYIYTYIHAYTLAYTLIIDIVDEQRP